MNAGATKLNPKFDRERGDFMLCCHNCILSVKQTDRQRQKRGLKGLDTDGTFLHYKVGVNGFKGIISCHGQAQYST